MTTAGMGEPVRLHTPPRPPLRPTGSHGVSARLRCWREAQHRREALAAGHELVPSDSRRCLVCGAPIHRFDGRAFCSGACLRTQRTVHMPAEVRAAS
jgi:hypothetical protein